MQYNRDGWQPFPWHRRPASARGVSLKIVVVSPHRDDAAFSLGLAIGRWLADGHSVDILDCFTRSTYAPYSDADSLHPNDRLSYVTALRAREDAAWTKMYRGGLTITDLRLKDAPLRLRCSPYEVLGRPTSPTDKAIGVIQKGLSRSGAQAFVLPLALGRHVDHVTACESSIPTASGQAPCAFYEDLPYAARPGAAEEIDEVVVEAARLLGEPLVPVFVSEPLQDPAAAIERKRKMALCFDSQIDNDAVEQIAGFCARYSGRERLWVNVAWQRSSVATAFVFNSPEAAR